jgi:hypothetical protein
LLLLLVEVTSWLISRHEQNRQELLPEPDIVDPFSVSLYLAIGLLLQLVLFPIAHGLPSVTALVAAGSTLTVVGISLKCWNAWQQGRTGHLAGWLVVSAGLPFLTVATQGFLGYGMAAMMTIFAFVAAFHGRSLKGLVAGALVAYLGLSLYVTYMRDRAGIREVVWGGSSLSTRVSSVVSTISSPAWFDLRDLRHVERIDERLNQNYLVGAAVRPRLATWTSPAVRRVRCRLSIVLSVLAKRRAVATWCRPTRASSFQGTSVGIGQVGWVRQLWDERRILGSC